MTQKIGNTCALAGERVVVPLEERASKRRIVFTPKHNPRSAILLDLQTERDGNMRPEYATHLTIFVLYPNQVILSRDP